FMVSIGLMVLHGILFLTPALSEFRHYGGPDMLPGTFLDKWMIPYEAMSFGAIAIAGSCFWDWFDREKPVESIKKRHIPIAVYSIILCFIVMWFIPFEHHDLTVSQDLLAIASGFFLLILFFSFEYIFKYKLPLLTELGRNPLILYISGIIAGEVFGLIGIYDLLADANTGQFAWVGLILCATSVAIVGFIGWILNKNKIYLRL
ncbi:MAG: hypothetical protein ACTSUE_01455, partial [Promethearchaeota archaeon]